MSTGARQRRWSLALLAVLLTLGSGLAFVALWINAGHRRPVLAVTADVGQGETIERSDLTVVRISSSSGLNPVPASQINDMVGKVAQVDLLAGSMLVGNSLADASGLESGKAIIAIPVPIQELPSPEPNTGATVRVYDTGAQGAVEAQQPELIAEGRVSAVEEHENTVTVTLTIDETDAPTIAGAIQDDRIYLSFSS